MTVNYNKDLNLKFEIANNHADSPSLFLWGVDANEKCDGLTVSGINRMIQFLEEQKTIVEEATVDKRQQWLFERGYTMNRNARSNNG
tara:strand:+ start:571 stop:831 length:261 start_codon:yes stop_codon:yes gene_type:complete